MGEPWNTQIICKYVHTSFLHLQQKWLSTIPILWSRIGVQSYLCIFLHWINNPIASLMFLPTFDKISDHASSSISLPRSFCHITLRLLDEAYFYVASNAPVCCLLHNDGFAPLYSAHETASSAFVISACSPQYIPYNTAIMCLEYGTVFEKSVQSQVQFKLSLSCVSTRGDYWARKPVQATFNKPYVHGCTFFLMSKMEGYINALCEWAKNVQPIFCIDQLVVK